MTAAHKDNGGSAFPVPTDMSNGEAFYLATPGMTLRDWFAGQAPITFADAAMVCGYSDIFVVMATTSRRLEVFRTMVAMRFEYADAMLEARE